ncbi:MAG: phosphoribosylformylglycinamidine synthase subunit PurS [bacterium]
MEVYIKNGLVDAAGEGLKKDVSDLGIRGVYAVKPIHVYEIDGDLSREDVARIGAELLADAVSQEYHAGDSSPRFTGEGWVVDVRYHPGVTDTAGASTLKGIRDMRIRGAVSVRTSMRYIVKGGISKHHMDAVCRKLLANTVIQTYAMKRL